MTCEEPPLSLIIMRGNTLRKYDADLLYNCLIKFDNGVYDKWFEQHNAFEFAIKIREKLLDELMTHYDSHPSNEPLSPVLMTAYKSYLRFYKL